MTFTLEKIKKYVRLGRDSIAYILWITDLNGFKSVSKITYLPLHFIFQSKGTYSLLKALEPSP